VVLLIAVLAIGGVGVLLFTRITSRVSSPSAWARVAHTFGSEGTGPGRFADARHIAIDGEGNIYVGEYSDGRIQVFDADGEFISLWMVSNDTPLTGLAADREGTVYVVQGGEILRYQGATGEPLGKVAYAEGDDFEDVAVTADGGLVASWRKFEDDVIRLNPQGQVVWIVKSAVSGQTGDAELDARVAVDGLGTVYVLGHFNSGVFRFSPGGKFENRFGSQGSEPGQFSAPYAIAVDGQGRVYVADAKGIQVFDADGRYLDLIAVDGPAFGMAFKDNALFVAARTQVIKYLIQQ
jgi:streptogramin lyase